MLACVSQALEVRITEEATRALDGMYGPENARDGVCIRRIMFQYDEISVELVEAFSLSADTNDIPFDCHGALGSGRITR